ncbi:hypothetical protein E5288_WYG005000 [Bos mutus]|uniref:Peroxisomal membrane protein PEX14 n=1 Tax=Bos mutus TaxID=72004 RepID=A0A6B0QYS8_9CETA|nr:hypothetical protein [Bos mutus]
MFSSKFGLLGLLLMRNLPQTSLQYGKRPSSAPGSENVVPREPLKSGHYRLRDLPLWLSLPLSTGELEEYGKNSKGNRKKEQSRAAERQHIATAVKFLQNSRVRQSPLATRRAFLKKKGLTDEEIDLAFQQSGTAADEPMSLGPATQVVPVQPPHLISQPYSPAGSRWRDYSALAIIMAGITFGFHQLYKKYLLPLIMGGREDRKQLERMEASLSELSGSVAQTVTQLQMTLASVQELLIQQQQKVQELAHELATAKATTSTNWILESQNINELKSEINSLKGLLLNRRQFPPSPSAPKIPSWQIPVKSPSPSSPAAVNHHSSSDISPVSNESTSSSPVKEGHSPEGSTATYHLLGPQEEGEGVVDVKGQVRMEVQGEEEKREDEEYEEDEDVSRVDEEDCLGVQREDRRGGDGQINEQVEKLRRPEGASNESERD